MKYLVSDEPATPRPSDRRQFLIASLSAAAVPHAAAADKADPPGAKLPIQDRVCLFTDHLGGRGYTYQEVAAHLKQLGVAGPDLTGRRGGLVPPDRIAEELPRAVGIFRDHGLNVPMVTTSLTSVRDPAARPMIAALGKLGIRYYKTGYFKYDDPDRWQERIDAARKDLASLVELGKDAGVRAGVHNHSGPSVGGQLWDAWQLLEPLDPNWVGSYFDPAQATIEGGKFGWEFGFRRLAPRLQMLAVKDFVWEKSGRGWQPRFCPLGEGMVRWAEFFRLLARVPFDGPVSLHIEYDPGGTTKTARLENSLAAARRDLQFLRKQLDDAFGDSRPAK